MSLPFSFESCPNRNVCSVTVPDGGIECGKSQEHLQPMPLAEELCPEALQTALNEERRYVPDSRLPNDESERDYRIGCLLFEIALHPETPAVQAQEYFTEGLNRLRTTKVRTGTKPKTIVDSQLVSANLPFLEARKFGHTVTDDTFDNVRREIADIGTFAMGIEDEYTMLSGLIKVGSQLLILREGATCYAATFRELCSARRAFSDAQAIYAHTGYLIENTGNTTRKIPLRVNHSKNNTIVNPHSVGLPMAHVVRKAFAACAPEIFTAFPGRIEATQNLIGWAIDETRGPLEPQQTATLDAASNSIFTRIETKYPEI